MRQILLRFCLSVFILAASLAASVSVALADCTSPAAVVGSLEYFTANKAFKYCDGQDWINVSSCTAASTCTSAGTLDYDSGLTNFKYCTGSTWFEVANATTLTACTTAGQIEYDTADNTFKSCDGSNWQTWAPADSSLVGHWRLNESSGTSAADSSGSGYTGTLVNTPTWETTGGQIAGDLDFNGTTQYVTMGDVLDWGATSDFSISFWVNRDTTAGVDTVLAKKNSTAAATIGYLILIENVTNKVKLYMSDGTDQYTVTSSTSIDTTGWYHVVAVWDDDTAANIEFYINGVDDGAAKGGAVLANVGTVTNAVPLVLAAESDFASHHDGKLDDVRIYNRVLTAAEISALFHGGAGCRMRIFHVSGAYSGNLGGLAGADSTCQSEATTLGYSGTWKAVLSDATTNAKDRLTIEYPLVRASSPAIIIDSADIWDGSLAASIGSGGDWPWTGSNTDGTKHANTCNSWTNGTISFSGRRGQPTLTDSTWINDAQTGCSNTATALYCIEQW